MMVPELRRYGLPSLMFAVACIAMNAAHAEVASVYGGSDGLCGSRTANGERVNCSAMNCGASYIAAWHPGEGLSQRLCCCSDQRSRTMCGEGTSI